MNEVGEKKSIEVVIKEKKIPFNLFDPKGSIDFSFLKEKDDHEIRFNGIVEEYPDIIVINNIIDFSEISKPYPKNATVHVTGYYEIWKPIYSPKYYLKYDTFKGVKYVEQCDNVSEEFVREILKLDPDEIGSYTEIDPEEVDDSFDTYDKLDGGLRLIKKYNPPELKKVKTERLNSKQVEYCRNMNSIKRNVLGDIMNIKSIKIVGQSDISFCLSLNYEGCGTLKTNKKYTYEELKNNSPFMEAMLRKDKYYEKTIWIHYFESIRLIPITPVQDNLFFGDYFIEVEYVELLYKGVPLYS